MVVTRTQLPPPPPGRPLAFPLSCSAVPAVVDVWTVGGWMAEGWWAHG